MTTEEVQSTLNTGFTAIQGVLTSIVVIIGIIAIVKIVIQHLPNIDDPNVKNAMWKSIGAAAVAVIAGAACVWIIPWIYSLFKK